MKTSYFKTIAVLIMAQAFTIGLLNAQNERSMYYMSQIPQAAYGNPTFTPDYKFYISLPIASGVYASYHNSGFSYNDAFTRRPDDSLVFDQNKLLKAMGNNNDVGFSAEEQLAAFGFKAGKNYFSVSYGAKAVFNFHYTKDLMNLLINGNAPFIGKTVDISGANVFGIAYSELAIGFAREVNSKLKVGVRLKYLNGGAAINSQKTKVSLSTDPVTYAITAVSDIHLDYAVATNKKDEFRPSVMSNNPGFGFDLGAEYKVNDKLTVNGSLIDIGSITWKEKVSNFVSTTPNNSFTFNGVAVNDLFSKNSSGNSSFNHLVDTLKNKFNVEETHQSFKTSLVKRVNLGATWHLNSRNLAGVIVRNEFYSGNYNPSVTLSMNHQFGQVLSGTITYSYIDHSFANLGAGIALNLGALQLYGVVDNCIAPIQIKSMQSFNAQFGINLVFGYLHKKAKPELPTIKPENPGVNPEQPK